MLTWRCNPALKKQKPTPYVNIYIHKWYTLYNISYMQSN